MALADKVKQRYNTARLIQLTNQGTQAGAAIVDAVLGYSATDVEADFQIYAGVEYDNDDDRHVAVAVEGVVAKLAQRSEAAGGGADGRHENYLERLQALAKVTGRDRIIPETKSQLTPSAEKSGTETVRPSFDRPDFDGIVPRAPDNDPSPRLRRDNP